MHDKTVGNAFFVNQFLQSLVEDELLTFIPPLPHGDRERKDKERGGWTWDIAQIQAKGVTDNVVDLMEGKIGKLAPATQQVLRLAACVGNTFDLKTLSIIDERPLGETLKNVLAGVAEGLLFPLDDHYKQMAVFEDSVLSTKRTLANDSEPERAVFKFVHDRVQQAAYAMIEPGQRDEIHLNIGRLLLANTSREALADKLFDIVNQLNHGTALISDRSEKSRLAELNLKAGQAAKLATAYDSALNYLNRGLGLLTEDSWQREYELTLELYVGAVQTARMSGKFEQMEHYADAVLLNARTLLDQMAIYESKMRAKTAQSQQGQAIKFALQGLRQLGLTLPENPSEEDVRQGFEQLQPLLAGKSIPDLIDLPPMTDPIQLAAMQIMMTAMPPAYQTNPGLMLLLDFKQIELSIKYGNTSVSLYSYATYGYILCSNYDDIDTGYQFGRLALNLLNKLDDNAMKCKIAQLYYTFVAHWKAHARETIQPLLDGYQSGLETGDIEYLTYCAQVYSCNLYLIGYDLVTVEQESAAFAQVFTRLKQSNILILQRIYWQAALNLLGQSSDPCLLVGQVFDEKIRLPQLKQSNNSLSLFMTYYNKLLLSYLFQDYRQARTNAEQAAKYAHGNPGALGVVIFNLYDSLSLLAVCPDTPETEQNGILERVAANQERMKYWADHAPMNYLHKFYLVEAERARVLGQDAAAGEYYDQAIELAKEHEYINEEALAYELAGKFYLAKGRTRLAGFYLRDAHYAYRRWGAIAKVKDVEQRYEAVLVGAWQQLQRPTVTTVSTSTGETARLLDIQTLVKASHTLSGEIVLPRLLEKMMRVMIENAGAENGFLLLPGRDCWCIEAEGALNQAEVRVLQSIPLETASGQHKIPQISEAIVNYVIRTRESLVLNDAVHEGRFSHDAYVVKRQPKSVLCIPLLNQGHLTGLLYLENNLTTGAFTSERLELLKLLSSQAAVSIENARLYANLQSSEKKYRAIFEESKDLIFISTMDGQFIDASPACETLLGFTRSEFLQLNALAVYARRADRTRFRKAMAHQGAVKDFEVRLRHKEGHEIESLVTATVRQSEDGNILGYQGIVRDITAQKEAARERLYALESRHAKEAAEAATRAKSSFLANMSHELRTPLNTIIGFTRLVARRCEDILPQIQHENLGKVLISADHLLMLINSILDLSKIESGHMEVLRTEVILPPLIDLCIFTVEPIAESKNLRLIKQVDANLPVLQTDIDKLKQILINFLSNAVKFTHEGSITIRVKQSGSNTIDFSVADTGIGVPEDAFEKIFEEFRQVDDDRARKYGGTGLGLAITQRLARLLGGEVKVESTIGVGSTFTLILPVN
ncbi:MAG: ATP-binding protein [Methylococcales bacterium]